MSTEPSAEDKAKALSFVYSLIYDDTVKNAFRKDPTGVMNNFGLSEEVQAAVQRAGNDGKPVDEHILGFMAYLLPELRDNYYGMW